MNRERPEKSRRAEASTRKLIGVSRTPRKLSALFCEHLSRIFSLGCASLTAPSIAVASIASYRG